MTPRILVVDDELAIVNALSTVLARAGYHVDSCQSGEAALEMLNASAYDLVLTDIVMPGITGLDILREIRQRHPDTLVILVTGHASVETAEEAKKQGAYDYIPKPFRVRELMATIKHALASNTPSDAQGTAILYKLRRMIGEGAVMHRMFDLMRRAAQRDEPVLLLGERGTGRGTAARTIHELSQRAGAPFARVPVDAIPPAKLEAALFGDAELRVRSVFAAADGGTVFLHEVTGLPREQQERLVRVLDHGLEVRRPDGSRARANCRLMASSSELIETAVSEGRLVRPLFARLNTNPIELPPLRQRSEDIPLLVRHFLDVIAAERQEAITIDPGALAAMRNYRWPGNLSEMDATLRETVHDGRVAYGALPEHIQQVARDKGDSDEWRALDDLLRERQDAAGGQS